MLLFLEDVGSGIVLTRPPPFLTCLRERVGPRVPPRLNCDGIPAIVNGPQLRERGGRGEGGEGRGGEGVMKKTGDVNWRRGGGKWRRRRRRRGGGEGGRGKGEGRQGGGEGGGEAERERRGKVIKCENQVGNCDWSLP